MNHSSDLKKVERKAFRSFYQDGLWDISWGIWILAWALIPILENSGISRFWGYPLLFVPAILITLGRRYITIPRLGDARFSVQRRWRRRQLIIWIAALLALTWSLFIVTITVGPGGWNIHVQNLLTPVVMGFLMTLLLCGIAYFMDYTRLYFYAVLMGIGIPTAEMLTPHVGRPLDDVLAFGFSGLGILLIGLILLVRFLKTYPKPSTGVADGLS